MTEIAEKITQMKLESGDKAEQGGSLREKLQDKVIARMEKEKGRTLTKHEMTTTIKALMKYNSKKRKSLKKRGDKKKKKTTSIGEDGKEIEVEVEVEDDEVIEDDDIGIDFSDDEDPDMYLKRKSSFIFTL